MGDQRCPRRDDLGQGLFNTNNPTPDTWREGAGLVNQTRGCSYCGSMHPDEFMQKLREGYEAGPTDKNYKVYLRKLATDEQFAAKRQGLIDRYVEGGMSESAAIERTDSIVDSIGLRSAGEEGKFYFQHLSEPQMLEFIAMLNDKTMKIGYPGYFYRRPFFIAPVTA
jgi:hypothetical protein